MSEKSAKNCKAMALVFVALAAFFIAGAVFRPLWPIDETRYLTVAWEMWFSGEYNLLSLNFAPYHHKPPMLFWLINASWAVFGVSRTAAMLPIFLAAFGFVWLTRRLVAALLPDDAGAVERATWLALGSAPFLVYASMVMFDIMLACFVLAVLLCFLAYARGGAGWLPGLAGLLLGCAVLTKGPVAYLYVLWPLLLYPFWRAQDGTSPGKGKWYAQLLLCVAVSGLPVLAWLYPIMQEADEGFIKWLVWRQTAGRITGDFKAAHVRPFYFYLLGLPILLVPWAFFRTFWSGVADLRAEFAVRRQFRFLLCWLAPVFLSFCAVSGKQLHYMMPLLPGVIVLFAWIFVPVAATRLRAVALGAVMLLVAGHVGLFSVGYFKAYDLTPVARYVAAHPDSDWGYVRNYQGELGFLGRITFPLESLEGKQVRGWFKKHPDGYVITRRTHRVRGLKKYERVFAVPYRGREMAVYRLPADKPVP